MTDNEFRLKVHLKQIEIELFSYCNRVCWFCPNSFIDRRSANILMPPAVYSSLINQLARIDYDGYITYSRYNEPTSKGDIFLERLQEARKKLPHAKLKTNTNGDYLTNEFVLLLRDAGLNELWVQQYDENREGWNHEKIHGLMRKKLEKLGFTFKKLVDIEGGKIEYEIIVPGMTAHLRARNFLIDGSSRGDTVPLGDGYVRTARCIQPFNNMYIDYNGNVMVCCALRSDIESHKSGIMGSILEKNLSEIFFSSSYDSWREHLRSAGPKEGFCRTCKDGVKPAYE